METEENKIMEYLKLLIQQQIKSQDETNAMFREILKNNKKAEKKNTIALILVAILILGGLLFIIYTENKPQSVLKTTLKAAQDLETRISLQRQYIDMNTKNIQDLSDSIKKK